MWRVYAGLRRSPDRAFRVNERRVVTPTRFERVALGLGIPRSILLSYGVGGAELRRSPGKNQAVTRPRWRAPRRPGREARSRAGRNGALGVRRTDAAARRARK